MELTPAVRHSGCIECSRVCDHVATRSNLRPQNPGMTIWFRDLTRVRSPIAPPYPRSPTILRWAFLCLEGQCWRHSGRLSRERGPRHSAVFAPFPAYLLSFLSVCLASARDPTSWIGAGLQGGGWKWRLLHWLRPETGYGGRNGKTTGMSSCGRTRLRTCPRPLTSCALL